MVLETIEAEGSSQPDINTVIWKMVWVGAYYPNTSIKRLG
jgi:hypothetical protein